MKLVPIVILKPEVISFKEAILQTTREKHQYYAGTEMTNKQCKMGVISEAAVQNGVGTNFGFGTK